MLRRMPAKRFRGWEIYDEVDPFGEVRADYRAASIVTMMANVNRGENQKVFKLEDFLLQFGAEPKRKQTPQEQAAILTLYAKAYAQKES